CSLLPAPCSLLPAPCSLLPAPCSLLPKTLGALLPLRIKFATGRTSEICTSQVVELLYIIRRTSCGQKQSAPTNDLCFNHLRSAIAI
ncbi:MAG: hypothetical protein F6K65_25760, partial [Moorea sp. SIO3C2]|nr:hypothetical protein [Moorena sp. SIO3C2]